MTMPAVFQQLPFGQGLAVVFFALLVVAALSSAISAAGTPAVLRQRKFWLVTAGRLRPHHRAGDGGRYSGQPVVRTWAQVTLFGKNIFELLDFVTSNLMMPMFGLALTLLLGWKLGARRCPPGWRCTGVPW